MIVKDLGLIDFHEAYAIQERLAFAIANGESDETLLLLEHPPLYTIGSGGRDLNILDPAIRAIRVNRGGDVTYHGPGQLVGYPIIDLTRRGRDLHRYLRFLEDFIIGVAATLGIPAGRNPGNTGVWSDSIPFPAKLASIGVGVRRWVTMHGFALNVSNDLTPFSRINPCGIAACPVTSIQTELAGNVPMDEIKDLVALRFEKFLNRLLPVNSGDMIKYR